MFPHYFILSSFTCIFFYFDVHLPFFHNQIVPCFYGTSLSSICVSFSASLSCPVPARASALLCLSVYQSCSCTLLLRPASSPVLVPTRSILLQSSSRTHLLCRTSSPIPVSLCSCPPALATSRFLLLAQIDFLVPTSARPLTSSHLPSYNVCSGLRTLPIHHYKLPYHCYSCLPPLDHYLSDIKTHS